MRGKGDGLALELAPQPSVELEDVGDHIGLDPAFGAQRLAGLERDEAGEFLGVFADQGGALLHQRPTLARRNLGPFFLGLRGILHRACHVLGLAKGRLADLLAGGRVMHGEGAAGGRWREAPANEVKAGEGTGQGFLVEGRLFGDHAGLVEHRVSLPDRALYMGRQHGPLAPERQDPPTAH